MKYFYLPSLSVISHWNSSEKYVIFLLCSFSYHLYISICFCLCAAFCLISFALSSSLFRFPSAVSNMHFIPSIYWVSNFNYSVFYFWKLYLVPFQICLAICTVFYHILILSFIFLNIFNMLILYSVLIISSAVFVGLILQPVISANCPSCSLLLDLFCDFLYGYFCPVWILWVFDFRDSAREDLLVLWQVSGGVAIPGKLQIVEFRSFQIMWLVWTWGPNS